MRRYNIRRSRNRNYLILLKSFEDAVKNGVKRTSKTLKYVHGVWVKDQSVEVDNGKITGYRVVLKVTFILAE